MSLKLSRRSANYTKQELDCLLTYLEENPDLVSIRMKGKYETPDDIRLAWDELADKITAIGGYFGTRRNGQEVKRKWSDLKSRVKAKATAIAMEADRPDGSGNSNQKLSPMEERALAIISLEQISNQEEASQKSDTSARGNSTALVKVFSFHHNESNSTDRPDFEFSECDGQMDIMNESQILEEIKLGGNEDKKRRISEAFSAERKSGSKRNKLPSEEEQLHELCQSQKNLHGELISIKETLKKCQLSIEKIALLKRAELKLKCAKYSVDFEDLFD